MLVKENKKIFSNTVIGVYTEIIIIQEISKDF